MKLDEKILKLNKNQLDQFDTWLSTSAQQNTSSVIPPRSNKESASLSNAQERLWFANYSAGSSPVYNLSFSLNFNELSLPVLKRCVYEVVRRHEALRTTFKIKNGLLVQVISPHIHTKIHLKDLSNFAPEDKHEKLNGLISIENGSVMDLTAGPLFKTQVIKLDENQHVFHCVIHHIISDGWSLNVLTNELMQLYEAYIHFKPSPLNPIRVQYADFSEWQRNGEGSKSNEKQLQYWRDKLKGAPQLLPLACANERPDRAVFDGETQFFYLSKPLLKAFGDICRKKDSTLYSGLLTVFNILLHKYSDEKDLVVGTPVANRVITDLEPLVGFFVNTILIRTKIKRKDTFSRLLKRVSNTTAEAQDNQEIPFELLVEDLANERSLSYNPLFQIMFTLEKVSTDRYSGGLADLTHALQNQQNSHKSFVLESVQKGTSKFDMTFLMNESKDGLTGACEYNTSIFRSEVIHKFLEHFVNLVEAVVEYPKRKISDLTIHSRDELSFIEKSASKQKDDWMGIPLEEHFRNYGLDMPSLNSDSRVYIVDKEENLLPSNIKGELWLSQGSSNGRQFFPTNLEALILNDREIQILGLVGRLVKIKGRIVDLDKLKLELQEQDFLRDVEVTNNHETVQLSVLTDLDRNEVSQKIVDLFEGRYNWLIPQLWINFRSTEHDLESETPSSDDILQPITALRINSKDNNEPVTFVEKTLAGIWSEIGDVQNISLDDNFFDIGGSSMSAFQLLNRVKDTFNVELEVNKVFLFPTLKSFAKCIEESTVLSGENNELEIEGIKGDSWDEELAMDGTVLSFGQEQLWFLYKLNPDSPLYNVPFVISWPHPVHGDKIKHVIEVLMERHQSLKTVFSTQSGRPEQIVLDKPFYNFKEINIHEFSNDRNAWGPEAQRIIAEDSVRSFDLEKGPTFRAILFHFGEQDSWLYLNMHHIISDGKSHNIMMQEIKFQYNLLSEGKSIDTTVPTIQYADFARDQRKELSGKKLENLLEFWRKELSETPPLLQLPYKGMRPVKQTFNGMIRTISFSQDEHKRLKAFGQENGTTVFMTLLAAFNALLYKYSKQSDIVIGVPVSNRYKSDFDNVIGYFVNTTVFRNQLEDTYKLSELLKRVKEGALRSMSHKELPFELLLGEIETERSQSFAPIFQVMFSHQETADSVQEEAFEESDHQNDENLAQSGTSKFDLSLAFEESANRLACSLEFSTDLFDVELIRAMSHDYKTILWEIMEHPDKNLSEVLVTGVPNSFFPNNSTVELNGFRFNLEAMRTAMLVKNEVADALFQVKEINHKKYLVGYLVLNESTTKEDLISSLEWPDYNLPSFWIELTAIPRDQNGDCLENELPSFEMKESQSEVAEFERPKTATQKNLAMIWMHILKVTEVGIHDNFFSLGGSSLPAIHVALKIKDLYGIDLPVDEIFDYLTIKALADYVDSVVSGEVQPHTVYSGVPALSKVQRKTDLPLSFAQERLWFLDQMEPNMAFYNVMSSCTFHESFDKEAMEGAIHAILKRHESLRTVFAFENGRPVQIIREIPPVNLAIEDVRSIPNRSGKNDRIAQLIQAEFQEPFDLELGPLFRYKIMHLEENEFIILFIMHHIVSDAWSGTILENEIKECYTAFKEKRAIKLPELPVQYVDFSIWQRRWMKGETLDSLVNFWRENLAGAPPLLELPFSKRRAQFQSFKGAAVQMEIKGEVLGKLKELSSRNKVTLFTSTLAAFQVLLHRYTGTSDIIVGTPSANRDKKGIENIIGFFTNTLVVRSQVEGKLSFIEFLNQVKENWKNIQKNKDLPFEKMVEMLQPSRSISYNPIFQIMFSFQKDEHVMEQSQAPESDLILDLEYGISKFDMTFNVIENEQGISLILEYNTDLFDKDMMKRMLQHYTGLLRSIAEDETLQISKIPLISSQEMKQLESFEIGEMINYPSKCLHHFFEESADRNPESIAVVYGDDEISFEDMEKASNRVANQLIELGIKPESRVAICLDPSIELPILTLAVLKAGGVLVPLDKNYPITRLQYMLDDSNANVLLVDTAAADNFSDWNGNIIIANDVWKEDLLQYSPYRPASGVTPENHLYVLYTSGSTGKPKGAILKHACVSNLINWQIDQTRGGKYDTLQFSPTSFDVSFQEIFLTWAVGARLIMIDLESKSDPSKTIEVMNTFGVERVFLPFVALDQIANESASSGIIPRFLKQVVTAGEQLRVTPQVRQLFEQLPGCSLENQYGPVETHIVTSFVLQPLVSEWDALPPIGKVLPNVSTFIVDKEFQRVPIGVSGELVIGGVQIATEYLNQPEKTAERFLKNPFGDGMVYLTGDNARYLDDGNIEFIGRLDNQVKIRGFRVEPGEIESILVKHEEIEQAVVVIRGDSSSNRQLVCYFMTQAGLENASSELANYLSDRVPEYMIPSFFIRIDELPKTPSGKINRLDLSNRELPSLNANTEVKLPETRLENRMAVLWENALGVKNIGVDTNFFDLGGHSLLATKLIAGIADEFHVRVPVRSIFKANTMEQLLVSVVLQKAEESDKYDESIQYLDEMLENVELDKI